MSLKLAQGFKYDETDDAWDWWIWVDGSESELDTIRSVVYTLDSSFSNPVRKIEDRATKFRLESTGWGEFWIYADVTHNSGVSTPLEHHLELLRPSGKRGPESRTRSFSPIHDFTKFEVSLKHSLDDFDWPTAKKICKSIAELVQSEPELVPEKSAKNILYALRRKNQFSLMAQMAEVLLQAGLRTQQIRRQYAQALIDQEAFTAAEMMLHSIIQEPQGIRAEELEARGLTARIYKQLYVNRNDPRSARNRANLERSLNEYLFVYRLDDSQYLWHGINVVALTARARRDHLRLAGLPNEREMARGILATLTKREENLGRPLNAWDEATAMEAYVALNDQEQAAAAALRFTGSADVDAFELASAIRQLTEVWQLNEQESPGDILLPICRAAYFSRSGAADRFNPKSMAAEAKNTEGAIKGLEKTFGPDGVASLKWYKMGLDRCSSVARIETRSGIGLGTGWLVQAADFFPGQTGVLLITNNHVVSPAPNSYAVYPSDCQINFQVEGEIFEVEDEVPWYSPIPNLDATLLKLKGVPKAAPLKLNKNRILLTEPPARMYIIGHPLGGDLSLSLQDNHLLGVNETMLHYRSPTEPGSSGSPVFEPLGWTVVALHHKGSEEMTRIDGKEGKYQANEGVSILAIQAATRADSMTNA